MINKWHSSKLYSCVGSLSFLCDEVLIFYCVLPFYLYLNYPPFYAPYLIFLFNDWYFCIPPYHLYLCMCPFHGASDMFFVQETSLFVDGSFCLKFIFFLFGFHMWLYLLLFLIPHVKFCLWLYFLVQMISSLTYFWIV